MGMARTFIGGTVIAGCAWTAALYAVEAKHPGGTEGVNKLAYNQASQTMTLGGALGGSALRATAPLIRGAKDAAQQSGFGELLTPPTTVAGAGTQPSADQPLP